MPWITELKVEKVKSDGTPYTLTKYRVGSYKHGRRKFKTFTNEKDARAFAKELGKILTRDDYNLPRRGESGKLLPTFSEAAEKWFETRETNCKPSTIENYRYLLDGHVLPAFGAMRLDEITREGVEGFVGQKKKAGMAPRSIRLMLATMRPVFKRAQKDGLVADNPAAEPAELIKVESTREKVCALTDKEVRDLLAAAREHLPRFHPFLFTAFRTGMRKGEIIALKWEDLDWRGKFIEVGRSFWKGTFSTTKSGKARRVDMSDQLAAVLEEHKKRIAAAALKAGRSMPDLVFPSATWGPLDPSHIRRDLNFVLTKAKMRRIRVHDARHTFASLLLRKGESPAYVQHQLGHHDISMTVGTYGHLIPGENRQAVNRLDDPHWRGKPAPKKRSKARTGNRLATGGEKAAVVMAVSS